jgi:hypothetical protein
VTVAKVSISPPRTASVAQSRSNAPKACSIVSPAKFEKFVEEDLIDIETRPDAKPRYRASVVQRAFFRSFVLVLTSGIVGLVLGILACRFFGKSDVWIMGLIS